MFFVIHQYPFPYVYLLEPLDLCEHNKIYLRLIDLIFIKLKFYSFKMKAISIFKDLFAPFN